MSGGRLWVLRVPPEGSRVVPRKGTRVPTDSRLYGLHVTSPAVDEGVTLNKRRSPGNVYSKGDDLCVKVLVKKRYFVKFECLTLVLKKFGRMGVQNSFIKEVGERTTLCASNPEGPKMESLLQRDP